jgi:hypothetical protein
MSQQKTATSGPAILATKASRRYNYDFAEHLAPLRDRYQLVQSNENWCALYLEISKAVDIALDVYLKKKSLTISAERRQDVSAEAAVQIANRFRKDPDYPVVDWFKVLNFAIVNLLHNKKQQFLDSVKFSPNLDFFPMPDPVVTMSKPKPDPARYITILCADPEIDGKRIVVDLGTVTLDPKKMPYDPHNIPESTFRVAVRKIATYTPKEAIYRYAVEIKGIFDTLRGPESFRRRGR